jgi:glyoxylate/hydroxypyruvate reductase
MGRSVARRLVTNGYPVRGWSARQAAVDGVVALAGDAALPHVLAAARIVVNLLPLTPATRGFFNTERFTQMPRGAGLVNLARGAHVVDADLLEALDSGRLSHAVLDVFGTEPLPAGHAFWAHPQITVLPHVAALTDARSAAQVVARNVLALRQGLPLQHLVDRVRGY